jgi:hypothetical protein
MRCKESLLLHSPRGPDRFRGSGGDGDGDDFPRLTIRGRGGAQHSGVRAGTGRAPPAPPRPVAILSGYQDRLLGGPLGLLDLGHTAPDGVEHKDPGGEVLG